MNYGFLWIKVFFLLGDVCLQILHSSPRRQRQMCIRDSIKTDAVLCPTPGNFSNS